MTKEYSDNIDRFIRLYEIRRETLNRRRDIEWKVCISFWTSIIVGTGFLIHKIQLETISYWVYFFVFLVFCPLWLGKMYHSSEQDHRWMNVYQSYIEKLLGLKSETINYVEPCRFVFLKSSWWYSQILMTGFFLYASWYLLTTISAKALSN